MTKPKPTAKPTHKHTNTHKHTQTQVDLSRKPSHQTRVQVEKATAPFQHALSTRAGDADPEATILSVDGISAYDSISRVAMMRGLRQMEGGDALLPFLNQFYGSHSTYLWEDDEGVVHEVLQGEGGEQALFSLGQHRSLEAIQSRLRPLSVAADVFTTIQEQLARGHQGSRVRRSCGTVLEESQQEHRH